MSSSERSSRGHASASPTSPQPPQKGTAMKTDTRMDLDTRTARTMEMPPGKTDHWVWDERLPGYGLRLRRLSSGDVRRTRYFQYDLAGKTYKLPLGDAMVLPDEKTR